VITLQAAVAGVPLLVALLVSMAGVIRQEAASGRVVLETGSLHLDGMMVR